MAIGAYGSGLLTIRLGLPFWASVPAACLIAAAVGVFVGLPSLRIKGLYLAVATLAAQEIVEWIVTHWTALTGGTEALVIPAPALLGVRLNDDFHFYWIGVLRAAGTALFAANLFRSRVGRAFVAIRDHDIAAEVVGVDVVRYKLLAFATSSFFVGLAGALLAQYRTIVSWERFTLETSIGYLAIIIIGGLGSIAGSFYGAVLMTLLPALVATLGRSLQDVAPGVAALLPHVQHSVFGVVAIRSIPAPREPHRFPGPLAPPGSLPPPAFSRPPHVLTGALLEWSTADIGANGLRSCRRPPELGRACAPVARGPSDEEPAGDAWGTKLSASHGPTVVVFDPFYRSNR